LFDQKILKEGGILDVSYHEARTPFINNNTHNELINFPHEGLEPQPQKEHFLNEYSMSDQDMTLRGLHMEEESFDAGPDGRREATFGFRLSGICVSAEFEGDNTGMGLGEEKTTPIDFRHHSRTTHDMDGGYR